MSTPATTHRWRFFRAGGFVQVKIETGEDLARLDELDQKLWVALACPVGGLDFDTCTAALIDSDNDGRIRAPELIAAVKWAVSMLKSPDLLIQGGDSVPLDAINDADPAAKQLLGSARYILASLGQSDARAITLAHALDGKIAFDSSPLNGDGVVVAESAADPVLRKIVNEIADCIGTTIDRSGKPGINQEQTDKFFEACAAYDAWMREGETGDAQIFPAGDDTPAASAAVKAIKAKVDDYFGRCRLAAFDLRLAPLLNRKVDDYAVIVSHDLSLTAQEVADFPLANVAPEKALSLDGPVNPAHAVALATLRNVAVRPLLGARNELTEGDWVTLQGKLAAYEAWKAAEAGSVVEKLGVTRVRELLAGGARESVNALIAQDKALEGEAAAVGNVEKLVRYVRDLRRLARNFVNFRDLYSETASAIFQTGVLYLDRRACYLCLTVQDAGKHAAMAALSGAYLAYCDCARKGSNETFSIVAIFSQGDDDNLMVGRNGVFYDRHGRDYDATITKIIASPISLREAFWSPYKKLARMVEEYVAKRASGAQANVNTELANVGGAPAATAAAATAKPKLDPSIIALASVALASLTAAFATVLAALGKIPKSQLPLVFAGIILLVSLPSVILAYIKLRKRNLGPILDANGWAINAKASINVPFGARLTTVAKLPPNASVDVTDIYEPRAAAWPKVVIVLFCLWWVYAIADDTGLLHYLTRNWDTPLGKAPTEQTSTNTTTTATDTNVPAK